jgi:two-component system chemotaxis response regulator CheB
MNQPHSATTRSLGQERVYQAIVLGVSTGGVEALKRIVQTLPPGLKAPLLVVQHMSPEALDGLALLLDAQSELRVKEADEGERPKPGTIYLAPANYHLLVEPEGTLSLTADAPVNYARPSVDVLFESAADAWGSGLIGVVLTGAGRDGAQGLKRIQDLGGLTIIQDPADADAETMPRSALALQNPDHLIPLAALPGLLIHLVGAV